jgi:hypothetical protein
MPPKSFFFTAVSRSNFVCQSCRAHLRRSRVPWQVRRFYADDADEAKLGVATAEHISKQVREISKNKGREIGGVTYRFFDTDKAGRVRQLKDSREFLDAMFQDPIMDLHEQMQEAKRLMKNMEASMDDVSDSDFLDALGAHYPDLASQFREVATTSGTLKLPQTLKKQLDLVGAGEQSAMPKLPRIICTSSSRDHRRKSTQLNQAIGRAHKALLRGNIDGQHILQVWKYYFSARGWLKANWDKVPQEVWRALWDTLSHNVKGNEGRMLHLYTLAQDMTSAGVALDGHQQLQAIEGMFVAGMQGSAVDNWKKVVATIGSRPETYTAYWELGLRMCAIDGQMERAERAADTLYKNAPDADPRCLQHLLRAHLVNGHRDKAWGEYQRLKDLLGESIGIEDYDEAVSCFLRAGQTEFAFHVFVDMMYSGAVDAHGKTRLPSRVANHFFFGKWLKRLIGAGDLDGAEKVLLFMQRKGIMTAAIQANGFIGGLIRSGDASHLERAERLAWAMIESRQEFVKQRRTNSEPHWSAELDRDNTDVASQPAEQLWLVPKATLETFCLLAENYKDRGLYGRLEELWVAFQESEISSDAFFTNQLLEAFVNRGEAAAAQELYTAMVRERQIVPDTTTYMVLLKSLGMNQRPESVATPAHKAHDMELCRQWFADMIKFNAGILRQDTEFNLQGLGRYLLHTFRKVEDFAGLIVALQVLCASFRFSPTRALAIEMIAETPEALLEHPNHARSRERGIEATQQLEAYLAIRMKAAASRQPEDVPDALASEVKTTAFSDVIREHYRKKLPQSDAQVEAMCRKAAAAMGVLGGRVADAEP